MNATPGSRRVLRLVIRAVGVSALVLLVAGLFWLRGALYRRFVQFPREAREWVRIAAEAQALPALPGWHEYRGVVHSHSKLSHDCEVPFEEILRVLQVTGRDFICLSDHATNGRADFNAQWRGLHEGRLFIPGFEMKEGLMPFGVAADVVLSNQTDAAVLARQVVAHGGVLFYAHPEEPRVWDRPELTGMEIYNIHADFKDEGGLFWLLPDLLLNQRRFPDLVFRRLFDRPISNLQRWDDLNQRRRFTGIAGNDCHQNTGVRAVYLGNNVVRIEDTSPKELTRFKLRAGTGWLAGLFVGPLVEGKSFFHLQLDPYERMVRYVSTHVFARELTEASILDALRAGRAFVAFDMMADSTGFRWLAEAGSSTAMPGETLGWSRDVQLRAATPVPSRFTVVKDGHAVLQEEGRSVAWSPPGPGVYRVEAELNICGQWTPWIYSNPIYLR